VCLCSKLTVVYSICTHGWVNSHLPTKGLYCSMPKWRAKQRTWQVKIIEWLGASFIRLWSLAQVHLLWYRAKPQTWHGRDDNSMWAWLLYKCHVTIGTCEHTSNLFTVLIYLFEWDETLTDRWQHLLNHQWACGWPEQEMMCNGEKADW